MTEQSIRLLLVEDSQADTDAIIERIGERRGFIVSTASSLREGLAVLDTPPAPTVILLDLGLPDSQGLNTLRAILKQAPDIPIVVITGQHDEQIGLEAMRCGADDFLVKTNNFSAFEHNINRSVRYAIERHNHMHDLIEAKERALAADRAKSLFLANMSHELRTPLNAILGFSEIISEKSIGSEDLDRYVGYARDIHSSGTHLLSLISQILEMSRIEAGRHELFKEPIEVRRLIEEAMVMVRGRARTNGISIETQIDPTLPIIMADRLAVKQIVINLLSNAVKFTPENGTVTVVLKSTGDMLSIVVLDTGCGIEEDLIPLIFKPFVQASFEQHMSHEGTGLGLPLSKSLAQMHGGDIEMQSEVGKGTQVTLTLPYWHAENMSGVKAAETSKFSTLAWLPSMTVGVAKWDADHRVLMRLINDLKKTNQEGRSNLPDALAILSQYTEIHLGSEEKVMEELGYPGFEKHKASHDQFRSWLSEEQRQCNLDPANWPVGGISDALTSWWVSHILHEDMAYRVFVEENQSKVLSVLNGYKGLQGL